MNQEIQIGVEYAFLGQAKILAKMGVPVAKIMPEDFLWGKMQHGSGKPIDFRVLDKLVSEYQNAGFSQIVLGLTTRDAWAVKAPLRNYAPQKKYEADYIAWVTAIVERYDGDGVNDMPGLLAPINYVEIGIEFSTYEPESVDEYIHVLTLAHAAAKAASSKVKILHAAFLITTAFRTHPESQDYEKSFAGVDKRIMYHSLADIRKVLDHPELFDILNIHALGDPYEIEDMVRWLHWETAQRKYTKPVIISDTMPTPFMGWGPATRVSGKKEELAIIIPPAVDADRLRLAAYFQKMVADDKETVNWAREVVACDMVEKVIIAAEQGVILIDTAFTEDIDFLKGFGQAGAGNSAWGGMIKTNLALFKEGRELKEIYPSFYAIQQLQLHLKGYTKITRLPNEDSRVRAYLVIRPGKPDTTIAWLNPNKLVLPDEPVPVLTFSIAALQGHTVTVEKLITKMNTKTPQQETINIGDRPFILNLTTTPVFITLEK
ncbi:MAG: hypothetical protein WCO98_09360 [bacterium]